MLDALICQIVHMMHFDYTLPIHYNFEKTKCAKLTSLNFIQVIWHILFCQSLEEFDNVMY